MALILKRSRFLHVPKTGGTWVAHAIARADIPHIIDSRYDHHASLQNAVGEGLFTFAFVRHPLTWWQSYWAFRMRFGWYDSFPLDDGCRDTDFNTFISNVLRHMPGYLTYDVYEPFVGKEEVPIDFIGKQENLVEDLITALRRAGETFNEDAIRSTPPANESVYTYFDATYRPEILQALAGAERESFRRFGYSLDPLDGTRPGPGG